MECENTVELGGNDEKAVLVFGSEDNRSAGEIEFLTKNSKPSVRHYDMSSEENMRGKDAGVPGFTKSSLTFYNQVVQNDEERTDRDLEFTKSEDENDRDN